MSVVLERLQEFQRENGMQPLRESHSGAMRVSLSGKGGQTPGFLFPPVNAVHPNDKMASIPEGEKEDQQPGRLQGQEKPAAAQTPATSGAPQQAVKEEGCSCTVS